jgi:hypothetical protein
MRRAVDAQLVLLQRFPIGKQVALHTYVGVQGKENDDGANGNSLTPDHFGNARGVRRRAHRLRDWPFKAIWQQL